MSIDEFINYLKKQNYFKELPEQYKSTKFCKLYYKIYNYMLSIPKEKIVIKVIIERNIYLSHLFKNILYHFIEAKDFYQWKDRIYSLLTEKLNGGPKRKYELLYGSKAKEFFNLYLEKKKSTCMKNLGVEYPMQSKDINEKALITKKLIYGEHLELIQEKRENTIGQIYGAGITNTYQVEEYKEKSKATCLKNHGVEHPAQSKEINKKQIIAKKEKYGEHFELIGEKISDSWKNKTQEEINKSNKKRKETCLYKYKIPYSLLLGQYHSKFGDEICTIIDSYLGNPKDSRYATKNKEWWLRTENGNYFFYDYCIPSKKLIVEADGDYTHGLLEGQKYVHNTPIEEIHKRNQEKEKLAIQNGYKIFHILYSEYKSNKSKCLENLIKEIKNYVHSQENMI